MVAHTAARYQPGVGDLDRIAQPVQAPGRQRIHDNHCRRAHVLRRALDPLGHLQPRGAQHPGPQPRHRAHPGEHLHQMPRHQQVVQRPGAQGVRRHGGVAQPRYQYRPFLRQQGGEQLCHRPDHTGEGVLLPLPVCTDIYGEIGPPWLAQGSLPLLIQDLHPGDREALRLLVPGQDPRQAGGLPRVLPPEGVGLLGQICTNCQHNLRSSLSNHTKYGTSPLVFRRARKICKKNREDSKNSLQFCAGHAKISNCMGRLFSPIVPIGGGVWFAEYQVR